MGKNQYKTLEALQKAKNILFSQLHVQYPLREKGLLMPSPWEPPSSEFYLLLWPFFINNIRQIIHIDVPCSMEEYFQEAGRAERDDLPSINFLQVELKGMTSHQ